MARKGYVVTSPHSQSILPAHLPRRAFATSRGCGNIQDGYVAITSFKQVINQRGFTAAHINDSRSPLRGSFFYHPKRHVQMRCVPTDLGRPLGTIDLFPMLSRLHSLILAPSNQADRSGCHNGTVPFHDARSNDSAVGIAYDVREAVAVLVEHPRTWAHLASLVRYPRRLA